MRNLKKNQKLIFGCNYLGKEDIVNESGYKTGEFRIVYGNVYPFKANISGAKGNAIIETIGINLEYDKVFTITTAEYERLKIDENTVFFVDKKPQYDVHNSPQYDYRIKRICDGLNEVVIAIEKVRNK